jgi:predicted nicotinamide N-methyase
VDVDAVLDFYIAAGLDRDPYWCRAWPSAICLAQQLLQRPELVAGTSQLGGVIIKDPIAAEAVSLTAAASLCPASV